MTATTNDKKEVGKSEIAQLSEYSTCKTFSQEKAQHSSLLSLNFT